MEGGQSYIHRVKFYQRLITPLLVTPHGVSSQTIRSDSLNLFLSEPNFTNEVSVLVEFNGNLKVL